MTRLRQRNFDRYGTGQFGSLHQMDDRERERLEDDLRIGLKDIQGLKKNRSHDVKYQSQATAATLAQSKSKRKLTQNSKKSDY